MSTKGLGLHFPCPKLTCSYKKGFNEIRAAHFWCDETCHLFLFVQHHESIVFQTARGIEAIFRAKHICSVLLELLDKDDRSVCNNCFVGCTVYT